MAGSIDPHRYRRPAIVGRMMEEGRLGLKTGSGFYDYAGRDVGAYRLDVPGARAGPCCARRGCGSPRRTDAVVKPRRAYADLPHGQVHYAECGERSAPAGAAAAPDAAQLGGVPRVLPLLGARYRAIAMDTAGFGASDRRRPRLRSRPGPRSPRSCWRRWTSAACTSWATTRAA
jgi:hypothetical protein